VGVAAGGSWALTAATAATAARIAAAAAPWYRTRWFTVVERGVGIPLCRPTAGLLSIRFRPRRRGARAAAG